MADLQQLEESIVSLSLLEAAELVKKLESRLGVSAAAAAPVMVAGGGAGADVHIAGAILRGALADDFSCRGCLGRDLAQHTDAGGDGGGADAAGAAGDAEDFGLAALESRAVEQSSSRRTEEGEEGGLAVLVIYDR